MNKKKKILWVVNVPLPEASELFGLEYQPYAGWLIELSNSLAKNDLIDLHIVFPSFNSENLSVKAKSGITYHVVSNKRFLYSKKFKSNWNKLVEEIKPDLVNIFGTEYKHSGIVSDFCFDNMIKCVVTIQGIPSYIAKHIRADLPFSAYYGLSIRNILLLDSVYLTKIKFQITGRREKKTIKQSKNVIGRTTWDKACMKAIDPDVHYYHCEETLRKSFINQVWDIGNVDRFSIFFSQGQYSLKGLHFIINEMPNIKKLYPEAKLYIAGSDIVNLKSLKEKLLKHHYHSYIKKIIKKNNLESSIVFTGPLDESAMAERYLKSHVFLSASTIENSPNSVAEALSIGTPTVASYVGGVPDMIKNCVNGVLYQSDAPYLIPSKLAMIFDNDDFSMYLSQEARKRSAIKNDYEKITKNVLNIYDEILMK